MSTLISPSVNLSGPQVSQAGPRGRGAEQPEGRGFGAALERSRAARGEQSPDASDAAPETAAVRRPVRDGERKSELSAADVLALLAPLAAPVAAPVVADPAHAGPGTDAALSAAKGSAGVLPDGSARDSAANALHEADAATAAASRSGAAEEASETVATDAAADTAHAAKPASAIDATIKTALAPAAAAETAAAPASASSPVATAAPAPAMPLPAAKDALKSASEAGGAAATAATDAPKTAAVQAAGAANGFAAVPETKRSEAIDADSASSPQTLPQLASALPAADRTNAGRDATPVLSVAPPVGSHEWGPAIGQQMIRMSASGHQVAELNLNPAGLGPLKVTLTMGDNQAQAMFVSAHEGVRRAVEAALPQLRTTLADQGISLGHTSVGAETRQPSQQGGFADQNPGRSSGQPAYPGAGRGIDSATAAQPAPLAPVARAANAGLDTFA